MSSPDDPRPLLSAENSDRLNATLLLCREMQSPEPGSESKLDELRRLLVRCRRGIDRQNRNHRQKRLDAVDRARNDLHFLPTVQHPQPAGRLRSASRRPRRAMRA